MTLTYRLDAYSTRDLQRELNRRILREASTDELRSELIRRETLLKPVRRSRAPRVSEDYVPVVRSEEPSIQEEPTSLSRSSEILALVSRTHSPSRPHAPRIFSDYSATQAG